MRLYLDITHLKFTVTKSPAPKLDQKGQQRFRRDANGQENIPMWTTEVTAIDHENEGAQTFAISTAGVKPDAVFGAVVHPVRLEAIPWNTNNGHGVAYRADALEVENGAKNGASKAA